MPGETLHAPHLLDVEIAQVLHRYVAKGDITETRGREALSDFTVLPIQQYAHGVLLPSVWRLRDNVTAYDAVYVALADALDAVLLTRDHRLAKAAAAHARVELV